MHFRNSWTRSKSRCALRQVPSGASGLRAVIFLMPFLTLKFHDTSVTRSLIGGNVRIGSTVTGSVRFKELRRVAHMRFRPPLIPAEHQPDLPRLAFHPTGTFRALVPCTRWTA